MRIHATQMCLIAGGLLACSPQEKPRAEDSAPTSPVTAWITTTDTNEMDSSLRVSAMLFSASRDSVDGKEAAVLSARCIGNRTEVVIMTDYVLDDDNDVRLRFDDAPVVTEQWTESTNGSALFSPHAVKTARAIGRADTLRFEFTPYNRGPILVRFALAGAGDAVGAIAQSCGWDLNASPAAAAAPRGNAASQRPRAERVPDPPLPSAQDAQWVADKFNIYYYRVGCRLMDQVVESFRLYFRSEAHAKANGFTRLAYLPEGC